MIFEKISRFFLAVVTLAIWLPILLWLYLVFTLLNFEIDPEQTDEEVEDEIQKVVELASSWEALRVKDNDF